MVPRSESRRLIAISIRTAHKATEVSGKPSFAVQFLLYLVMNLKLLPLVESKINKNTRIAIKKSKKKTETQKLNCQDPHKNLWIWVTFEKNMQFFFFPEKLFMHLAEVCLVAFKAVYAASRKGEFSYW